MIAFTAHAGAGQCDQVKQNSTLYLAPRKDKTIVTGSWRLPSAALCRMSGEIGPERMRVCQSSPCERLFADQSKGGAETLLLQKVRKQGKRCRAQETAEKQRGPIGCAALPCPRFAI